MFHRSSFIPWIITVYFHAFVPEVLCAERMAVAGGRRTGVSIYRSGEGVFAISTSLDEGNPTVYVLAKPQNPVPSTDGKEWSIWKRSKSYRAVCVGGDWQEPESIGIVKRWDDLMTGSSPGFFVLPRHTQGDVFLLSARSCERAGLVPFIEHAYPILCVPDGGDAERDALAPMETAQAIETRPYGPMSPCGLAKIDNGLWYVFMDSGHVFLVGSANLAGAARKGVDGIGLPARVECGMRLQMVGAIRGVGSLTAIQNPSGQVHERRPDRARCHGVGLAGRGTVPVLCSRLAIGKKDPLALELHVVERAGPYPLVSRIVAQTTLAAGLSPPIVLSLHPSRRGQIWWVSAVLEEAGSGVFVACYGPNTGVQVKAFHMELDGRIIGGFVDGNGKVDLLLLRVGDEQQEEIAHLRLN